MKGVGFILIYLPFLRVAHAAPINDTIHSASRAYGDHVTETMWRNRCSRPESLRLHANCYVNPNGVALWQMSGPDRERWKPIAIQESLRLQQEHRRQMEIAREQGQTAANAHRMNHQICEFWKQQSNSERQKEKSKNTAVASKLLLLLLDKAVQ